MNGYTVEKGTMCRVYFKGNQCLELPAKNHFYFFVEDIVRESNSRIVVGVKSNPRGILEVSIPYQYCYNHHDDTKAINNMIGRHIYIGSAH